MPVVSNPHLRSVDFSDNMFDGRIADEYFKLPRLEIFSCTKNCLSPEIPVSICNSSTVRELYISGLQSANSCRNNRMNRAFTLPDCLWTMNSLEKLYLSGNGYFGNFELFQLGNLSELSAGSNRLRGSIPSFLNNQSMDYFDISHNMIIGTLDIAITPHSSSSKFNVEVNRLSGPLQSSVFREYTEPISVLNGNVFSCGEIPSNDEDSSTYNCGSLSLNITLYMWCAAISLFCCVYFLYAYWKPEIGVNLVKKWEKETSDSAIMAMYNSNESRLSGTACLISSLKRL